MKTRFSVLSTLLLLAASVLPAQSVPTTINFQGRLTDNTPAQTPVNATSNMQFEIWDVASGGTAGVNRLWREPNFDNAAVLVPVSGGIFNWLLGGSNPIPPTVFTGASSTRYLQIILNPGAGQEILAPRQVITASGYANLAQNANSAVSAATATTALSANTATTATTATTAATANDALALGGTAASGWQKRVSGTCAAGSAVTVVAADGSVTCATAGTSGQSATTAYGTAGLTVTPTTPQTLIPGLTQTVTVPANSVVLISTDGGVATASAVATGFSVVDVFIVIDGAVIANGGYQRVMAVNNGGVTGVIDNWAISQTATLAAGSHTIAIRTQGVSIAGNANATVSGNNTSPVQGELTVQILLK